MLYKSTTYFQNWTSIIPLYVNKSLLFSFNSCSSLFKMKRYNELFRVASLTELNSNSVNWKKKISLLIIITSIKQYLEEWEDACNDC